MRNEINVFQHVQTAPRMQQNAPFEIITFKKFLGRPFPQIPLPRRWKISFPHSTPPARYTIPPANRLATSLAGVLYLSLHILSLIRSPCHDGYLGSVACSQGDQGCRAVQL